MKIIECNRWSDFCNRAYESLQFPCEFTLWRGQRDPTWPLASSFDRMILQQRGGHEPEAKMVFDYDGRYSVQGKPVWQKGEINSQRERFLQVFKTKAMGLRGVHPRQLNDIEWWALGRHHGLITPLLDWSESPFIAAFFPIQELADEKLERGFTSTTSGDEEFAVYCLRLSHADSTIRLGDCELAVSSPNVDELARMHAQLGHFTFLRSERYFELEGFLEAAQKGDRLTKFVLRNRSWLEGMVHLRLHGITHRSVFPDLSGAAFDTNRSVTTAWLQQVGALYATGELDTLFRQIAEARSDESAQQNQISTAVRSLWKTDSAP